VAPSLGVSELRRSIRRPPAPSHPDFADEDTDSAASPASRASLARLIPDTLDASTDFASIEPVIPRMREAFFAENSHRPS